MSSAGLLPDRASDERGPVGKEKRKEKRTAHLRAPGVVKPHSGPIMVVPLPLCPWYLQSIMMYVKGQSCNFVGAGDGAALLRLLGTRRVVLL